MFDRTAADAVLKEDYLPPIREQLNMGTPLLAETQKNTENVVGKEAYVPLHISRSESIGARTESGSLPTANAQGYTASKFFVKYLYGRIEVNLPTIESTKSDSGSFLRAVDSETRGVMNELKEDVDRQLAANDELGTGTLAVCASATGSTVTVTADATTFRKIRVGMFVDVVKLSDGTTGVGITNSKVTGVNTGTSVITLSVATGTPGSIDATYGVFRTGNYANEMRGYPGLFKNSGVLQGVDPASYADWKGNTLANGGTGRALSEDLLQQLLDNIGIASGEEPDAFLVEHTQRRKFYGLMTSMKRAVNTTELKGGFTTLTFNDNIPFLVDRFYTPTKIGAINRKHVNLYELSDWKWADNDGSVLSRVSGKPSFEAFLYKYADLGTDRRNSLGELQDLNT